MVDFTAPIGGVSAPQFQQERTTVDANQAAAFQADTASARKDQESLITF